MINQPPDGIVITLPVKFLIDLAESRHKTTDEIGIQLNAKKKALNGYKILCSEMDKVMRNPDHSFWTHSMGIKPTLEFEYVYFTVLGSIRYRGNVMLWEPGHTKEFQDGRKRTANYWLNICNIIPAPLHYPFKGCQGFRYTQKIF
jgi:hypothetical protein